MANHASAKKRIRQTVGRTARNKHLRTTVRTYVRRVRDAIEASDKTAATAALKEAVSRIDGAVHKGIFHRKTGARYISRLATQVAKL